MVQQYDPNNDLRIMSLFDKPHPFSNKHPDPVTLPLDKDWVLANKPKAAKAIYARAICYKNKYDRACYISNAYTLVKLKAT